MKEVVDMPEKGNPACLLVLEEKPNSFIPIDLKKIGFSITTGVLTVRDIDYLTFTYGVKKIKEVIRISNVVSNKALDGNLVILYEENAQKRKIPIIDKHVFETYDIMNVLFSNIDNKEFVNQIINKIRSLKLSDEICADLIVALKQKNIYAFFEITENLGYLTMRKIYLWMIKWLENRQNVIRIREKSTKKED